MLTEGDIEVPEITKRQVWNTLTKLKRTATGPGARFLKDPVT